MLAMLRCDVCGYFQTKEAMGQQCPACGAPGKAIKPYTLPMSQQRYRLLSWHIHPIMVHFPSVLTILALVFIVLRIAAPMEWLPLLDAGVRWTMGSIPIFAILSVFTGRMDAQARFKKLSSPHLHRKIQVGILLILLSLIGAWQVLANDGISFWLFPLALAMNLCTGVLGRLGGELNCAFVADGPAKGEKKNSKQKNKK